MRGEGVPLWDNELSILLVLVCFFTGRGAAVGADIFVFVSGGEN